MRNFTVQLVAAAATLRAARAQLPRECFYVTEMHGFDSDFSDLLSDLPTLMTMYKPGMQLKSITALQDPDAGNLLTGLQVDLIDRNQKTLQLPMVGAQLDEWESQKVYFKAQQPDKISILTDTEIGGVCDVVIYQGNTVTSLSKDTQDCLPDEDGIEETWLRLPEDTPLVGFHGESDGDTLNKLGLILVNTQDPVCQKPLTEGTFQVYQGSIFDQSEEAEGAITEDERAKAAALEALLAYDTIQKARESKEEIRKQIEELNGIKQAHADAPLSSQDLKQMLDGMAKFDVARNPRTKQGLRKFFDKLIYHYQQVDNDADEDLEYDLPIKISELRYVYKTLAIQDGDDETYFDGRQITESATVEDLVELFDELSRHFQLGVDGDLDLNMMETKALADIFSRLEMFYAFDADETIPDADNLWPVYEQLAETFGKASDYSVSQSKAQELYDKIQKQQDINRTFEGHKVQNYADLKQLEQDQSQKKLAQLRVELQKFESIEEDNIDYLEEQLDVQNDELESILSTLKHDEGRFDMMKKALLDLERREQKKDMNHKLGPVPPAKPDSKDLPPPPYYLRERNDSSATISKMEHILEDLPQLASAVESGNERVSEVEHKLDATAENMIYTFIGILVAAIVLGMALGAAIIFCCLKSYTRGQQKRLAQAGRMNLRFTEGNDASIDMRTMPAAQTNPDEELPLPAAKPAQRQIKKQLEQQVEEVEEADEDGEPAAKEQERRPAGNLPLPTVNMMRTENDDEENDFVNVLTSRGLTYDMPKERRTTFKRKSALDSMKASNEDMVPKQQEI